MKNLTHKLYQALKRDNKQQEKVKAQTKKLNELYDGDKEAIVQHLLEQTIYGVLVAAEYGIDLFDSLEKHYKGEHIRIWIPIMPPGINATYGVNCAGNKKKVYKTKEAKDWEIAAKLPILNAANYKGFLINKDLDKLAVSILSKGSQHDIDANVKIILDTTAKTLNFNDKIVHDLELGIKRNSPDRGVLIELEKI